MNTLHGTTKAGNMDINKPVNMRRQGKGVVKNDYFETEVSIKKHGSNFHVIVEGRTVYGAGNTAFDAWQWLCKYLSIKNV